MKTITIPHPKDVDAKLLETYRKLKSTKTEATKREAIALIDKLLDQKNQQKKS